MRHIPNTAKGRAKSRLPGMAFASRIEALCPPARTLTSR
jgi:hypothetical protein